jgi:hypothetical protein
MIHLAQLELQPGTVKEDERNDVTKSREAEGSPIIC